MFLRVGNLEEWQKILLCITANSGGKHSSRIAGNINLMNYFLTFVVSTDGACINEAFTSLDV